MPAAAAAASEHFSSLEACQCADSELELQLVQVGQLAGQLPADRKGQDPGAQIASCKLQRTWRFVRLQAQRCSAYFCIPYLEY